MSRSGVAGGMLVAADGSGSLGETVHVWFLSCTGLWVGVLAGPEKALVKSPVGASSVRQPLVRRYRLVYRS